MPGSASQQPQWQRRCHDLWKRHCPAVKHLFAPIARESILIKEHGRTSLVCACGSPVGRRTKVASRERQGFDGGRGPIFQV